MVKLYWTDEALKWLKDIHDYIAEDNTNIAKEVIKKIIAKTEILKTFPNIGQRLLNWLDENIRMILFGHYRIVYLVVSKNRIDILGIYHGSLDLVKHFKR